MATAKPVITSPLAAEDIDAALVYYIQEAGAEIALRFIAAMEAARERIGRQPGIGSPRYAHAVNMAGLRSWPLTGFPYVLFYFDQPDAVDLIRVLHGSSDIASWLAASEGD